MFSEPLTWTCHVCGRERPDAQIGVAVHDISGDKGLAPGTINVNVRYCRDSVPCFTLANRPDGYRFVLGI